MKTMLIIIVAVTTMATSSFANFLPDDFVPRRMSLAEEEPNDTTEEDFNEIIEKIETIYAPIIELHGAELKVNSRWSDDLINASARQSGRIWEVNMYGGLARYSLLTKDGFAMVMCHELGHHIAGFPIKPGRFGFGAWAANEGQSDYFAAQVCGPKIWEDEVDINATFREDVNEMVQDRCDTVYAEDARQNLCYRVATAGLSLARTLADLSGTTEPNYETPNPKEVKKTNHNHPEGQCRLDTTFAGALCSAEHNVELIPGKDVKGGVSSARAEIEAADNSCMRIDTYEEGLRPLCWFKPKLEFQK